MKSISLFVLVIFIATITKGQKVFMDNTDPFTGTRTVTMKDFKINGLIMTMLTGQKSKDSISISIMFSNPHLEMKLLPDTAKREALIKFSDGTVDTLVFKNTNVSEPLPGYGLMATSMYTISVSQRQNFVSKTVTAIKFTGAERHMMLIEPKGKDQQIIGEYISKLLEKLH